MTHRSEFRELWCAHCQVVRTHNIRTGKCVVCKRKVNVKKLWRMLELERVASPEVFHEEEE